MRIIVTGASGFVGRALCPRLAEAGHDVVGLGKDGLRPDGLIAWHPVDITRPLPGVHHAHVLIHLAAHNFTHVGAVASDDYIRVNVDGVRHVLDAFHGQRIIFLSTAKVYAPAPGPLDEAALLGPCGDYARSKLAAEEVVQASAKGRPVTILRSVNVIGQGQPAKAVVPVFVDHAKAGRDLVLSAHPMTLMQMIDVDDVCALMINALRAAEVQGIFNAAGQARCTLHELASKVIALTGSRSRLQVRYQGPDPVPTWVSAAKAQAAFDWTAQVGLEDSIRKYL